MCVTVLIWRGSLASLHHSPVRDLSSGYPSREADEDPCIVENLHLVAIEAGRSGVRGDHWDSDPVVGADLEVDIVSPFDDGDGATGLHEPRALREEGPWVVRLVQDERREHHIRDGAGDRHPPLGCQDDVDVGDARLRQASTEVVEHLRLHVCRDYMASGADNVARGDGEEAGAATEVDDGHPRTHPGVPQRRIGRERLGALLR